MQTIEQHVSQKISIKKQSLDFLPNPIAEVFKKRRHKRKRTVKRLSPFLLLAFFLPVVFAYSFITEKINSENFWFQLFILVFLEVNILFADFALWNYYQYKNALGIWLIESGITYGIIYLML